MADMLCLAKPMLLTFVRNVGDRNAFLLNGRIHHLSLVWRYDLVFQPLEQDQRHVQTVDMMDRRALHIEVTPRRVWTDHAIEITGLKLVGLLSQGFQIANAIIACA